MSIEDLKLKDVMDLINALRGQSETRTKRHDPAGAIRIMVLHRGWVVVGRVYLDCDQYRIEQCRCIRRWGGPLADLARGGPIEDKTVLEALSTVWVDASWGVIQMIECSDEWDGVLS